MRTNSDWHIPARYTHPALAQTTGRLKGRVSDRSGGAGAIEKTHIIIESSSGKFEAIASDNGEYDLELPAGTYNVSTKKVPGFVSFNRNKVQVKPGKETVLNVKLKVTLDDAICVLYITSAPIKKKEAAVKKRVKD
jgi:carboxypeptidase family protein